MVERLGEGILRAIFPAPCPGCGGGGHGGRLCEPCAAQLPLLGSPACAVCAEPFAPGAIGLDGGESRCAACSGGRRFARAHVLGPLRGSLHELVTAAKFHGRPALAFDLGRRAALAHAPSLAGVAVVVPVPLGRGRARSRGYDQAEAAAEGAARALRRPLLRLLRRTRETEPQATLSRAARRENVRNAFAARRPPPGPLLLVDDVITTGATADAAARALSEAGGGPVLLLAVARTLPPDRP